MYLARWRDGLVLPLEPWLRRVVKDDRFDLFWIDHMPRSGPCNFGSVVSGESLKLPCDERSLAPAVARSRQPIMSFFEPDGLRFTCSACGDCCTGEPGNVWVNTEEIAALAAALDLSVSDFEREYVRKIGSRRSLFERFDGDCVLFDPASRRCTVYQARPTQCRTWPFWPANVESREAWEQTCAACPGSGQGELHSVESIRARLREHRLARRQD